MDATSENTAPQQSEFIVSRWVFLRLLGLTYLIAILSLWSQIHGLIGSRGILPAEDYLMAARQQLGGECYWRLPTLCWLDASDMSLTVLCAAGSLTAILLILDVAPFVCLVLLWLIYLSLSVVGQIFLSFQWDTLLLETGFLAVFYVPLARIRPTLKQIAPTYAPGRWLLWWLIVKLMLLSGLTKLLSGDPTWRDWTAMDFHYQTQPIPSWISWYAHHMPQWWHKTEVGMTYFAELVVPLFVFGPRRLRHVACLLLIALQILIELTGNFGFFNLLSIALCITLLDDRFLTRFLPQKWREPFVIPPAGSKSSPWKNIAFGVPIALVFFLSVLTFVRESVRTQNPDELPRAVVGVLDSVDRWVLSWAEPGLLDSIAPFRTINGYGLFRVMTTERPEIIVEGSQDNINWRKYEFAWKPGDLTRPPGIVAPHMPRLDWQMWFAALNPSGSQHWLGSMARRLLQGERDVIDLLHFNPFSESPPRFIRLTYYRYDFSDRATRLKTGQWWTRTELGPLTRGLSL